HRIPARPVPSRGRTKHMQHTTLARSAPRGGRLAAVGTAIAIAAAASVIAVLAPATPALGATNQFRGMNWAVLGDNFSTSPLVLHGLSQSDSYSTVRAKANAIY